MAGFVTISIKGTEKIQKAMEGLKDELRPKALRAGIVAGSRPVKKKMYEFSPYLEGYLRDAIGHRSLSASAARTAIGIGAGRPDVAVLVGVTRKTRAGPKGGRKAIWHEYGTVKMEANEFLRPGWEHASGEFEKLFLGRLERYVKRNFNR